MIVVAIQYPKEVFKGIDVIEDVEEEEEKKKKERGRLCKGRSREKGQGLGAFAFAPVISLQLAAHERPRSVTVLQQRGAPIRLPPLVNLMLTCASHFSPITPYSRYLLSYCRHRASTPCSAWILTSTHVIEHRHYSCYPL